MPHSESRHQHHDGYDQHATGGPSKTPDSCTGPPRPQPPNSETLQYQSPRWSVTDLSHFPILDIQGGSVVELTHGVVRSWHRYSLQEMPRQQLLRFADPMRRHVFCVVYLFVSQIELRFSLVSSSQSHGIRIGAGVQKIVRLSSKTRLPSASR